MKTEQILNDVLAILRLVRDDKEKMQKIHNFFMNEIYEEEDEEFSIPDKYSKLIGNITDSIDCGMTCYVNTDTLEMEEVHQAWIGQGMYSSTFVEDEELDEKYVSEFKHYGWKNKFLVEPLESHESFKIMERFVDQVSEKMQGKLVNALNRKHPFANFKIIVESSEVRQQWFDFKKKEIKRYVFENYFNNFDVE